MLIDWFTVGAQTLNFLILVWLLKRFLYRPVLDAIDAREKAIATTVADAGAKQLKAQTEQAEFTRKNRDLEAQRASLLAQAAAQAQAERERLLTAIHAEAEQQRTERQRAIEADYEQLRFDITRRACEQILTIARKTLSELAGAPLEQQICAVFMQRLRALDGAQKAMLLAALKASGGGVRCRTAAPLEAQQQSALSAALDAICHSKVSLAFEVAPELISGAELDAGGYKLAWNIDDYLASLGESIAEAVHEQSQIAAADVIRGGAQHLAATKQAAGGAAPGPKLTGPLATP